MLSLDLSIDEALGETPGIATVFVRRGMVCVGCDIGRFHTIREAATLYGIDAEQLLTELQQAIEASESRVRCARAHPAAE
ncbi:MAG: DUF1858 domain-containing protein [Anaerolineae bacterium]|nr:DUF1858 domain-containing protein [Thermoflexales bacterium]MDW8407649.1 DUF1858 domain-containing protein [Anaerolineae bacterium]